MWLVVSGVCGVFVVFVCAPLPFPQVSTGEGPARARARFMSDLSWVPAVISGGGQLATALSKHFCRPGWPEIGAVVFIGLCTGLVGFCCGCAWGVLGAQWWRRNDIPTAASIAVREYTGEIKRAARAKLSEYLSGDEVLRARKK